MNRRPVHAPERYCPICGVRFRSAAREHHCRPSVYRAIDAANTRAERDEERELPMPLGQRLEDGWPTDDEDLRDGL